jgi:AbiU2
MTTAIHRTPEEAKNHFMSAMGEDLGRVFYALWQEVTWLHNEWDEYLQLFGTKPSRIALMNDAAPRFFRMIQDELVDMIVLRIARLTDPPKSTGKSNLTIQQLPTQIKDQSFSNGVLNLVKAAVASAEFCRARRHRRIAHNALDLSLGVQTDPLPDLTRENIAAAIVSLAKVLNAVSFHYVNSTTEFGLGSNSGGARSLIRILEDGVQKKSERIAEMKRNSKNWNMPRSGQ